MAKLTKRLMNRAFEAPDVKSEGFRRSLKGLREGDYRELSFGLILGAVAYIQNTKPKKELIYRREVPTGSALVIHHKKSDNPKLEIRRP